MDDVLGPYGAGEARADAQRLRQSPNDEDLLAEVRARLGVTNAVHNPDSDDYIDPTEALQASEARAIADALEAAAESLRWFHHNPPKPKRARKPKPVQTRETRQRGDFRDPQLARDGLRIDGSDLP